MLPNREQPIKLSDFIYTADDLKILEPTLDPVFYARLVFQDQIKKNCMIINYEITSEDEALFVLENLKKVVLDYENNLSESFRENIQSTLIVAGILYSLIWDLNEKKIFTYRLNNGLSKLYLSIDDDMFSSRNQQHQEEFPVVDELRGITFDRIDDVYNSVHVFNDAGLLKLHLADRASKVYEKVRDFALENINNPSENGEECFAGLALLITPDSLKVKTLSDCLDESKFNPELIQQAIDVEKCRTLVDDCAVRMLDKQLKKLRKSILFNSASSDCWALDNSDTRTSRLFNPKKNVVSPIAAAMNEIIIHIGRLYSKVKQVELESKNEVASAAAFRPM